ncbi:hypothetical protein J5X84_39035 [Streptosporangiaceae bacterium NEAU-GS5]|nr:hypothetical protein [Streptosporangiaceae bacterium NEAU-GS5]
MRKSIAVALLFITTACASGTPAQTSAALEIDAIAHSGNVSLLGNLPLRAPFDKPQSWGTDVAFQGHYAYIGNYDGFTVADIGDPARPKAVARVFCPGAQNDVSVWKDLLFLSVDQERSDDTCHSTHPDPDSTTVWEGIRIFDISDRAHPRYLKAVRTECGSHTHTLIPAGDVLYLYVSSAGPPLYESTTCTDPHDIVSVVKVPLSDPKAAKVVAKPHVFKGGCHDITVYLPTMLAAGACYGDGVLMDIADPIHPRVLQTVSDPNFAIWHSATFNQTGTKVVFSDELGGGVEPTCDRRTSSTMGGDAVYELTSDRHLVRHGYFKIPREQTPTENCVAHNGSLIPIPGRDVMVQAWYQGGISVWDFTDSDHPREIGYFERGPLPPALKAGGSWSAYCYNGLIYSSDMTKGLDILRIDGIPAARMTRLNAQTQTS